MNLKPTSNRVFIEPKEVENITDTGLIIPGQNEKPTYGLVLAVGGGTYTSNGTLIPLDVKVGDNVMFEAHAGTEITFNNEEVLMMRESDIIGIING